MIVEHEHCPYCESRLLNKYETCPHCNGPLGKTRVFYIEEYKKGTLYRLPFISDEITYYMKYEDGTDRRKSFYMHELIRFNSTNEMTEYVCAELCKCFQLDPNELEKLRYNDYSNYSFAK